MHCSHCPGGRKTIGIGGIILLIVICVIGANGHNAVQVIGQIELYTLIALAVIAPLTITAVGLSIANANKPVKRPAITRVISATVLKDLPQDRNRTPITRTWIKEIEAPKRDVFHGHTIVTEDIYEKPAEK